MRKENVYAANKIHTFTPNPVMAGIFARHLSHS